MRRKFSLPSSTHHSLSTPTHSQTRTQLNDVNGLGTIIAEHLKSDQAGQVLVIANNALGTNIMEKYVRDKTLFGEP